jgi:hypothetical protein
MPYRYYYWFKRNKDLLFTGVFSLVGFVLINKVLGFFDTGISPEFLGRAIVKLFYIVCAALISAHSDHWIAPSLAKYVEDINRHGKTQFEVDWTEGNVKRPAIALAYYVSIFIGIIIAFCL